MALLAQSEWESLQKSDLHTIGTPYSREGYHGCRASHATNFCEVKRIRISTALNVPDSACSSADSAAFVSQKRPKTLIEIKDAQQTVLLSRSTISGHLRPSGWGIPQRDVAGLTKTRINRVDFYIVEHLAVTVWTLLRQCAVAV